MTVKDVPGSNIIKAFKDEKVFADGEVTSVGQIIAMVIADDKLTAQRLAKRVKVNYQDLPSVLTIEVLTTVSTCTISLVDTWHSSDPSNGSSHA